VRSEGNPPEQDVLLGGADGLVLWGIAFEEAREIGDVFLTLDEPVPTTSFFAFRDMVSLQYSLPGIEWVNIKSFTWYQGHFADYPLYAERVDERTIVYRAHGVTTCRLRVILHANGLPVTLTDIPTFHARVQGTCNYKPYTLTLESGLWGKGPIVGSLGVYNGEIVRWTGPSECMDLELQVTDRTLPPYTRIDPDRTLLTVPTEAGTVTFRVRELDNQPYLAIPDFGLLVYRSRGDVPEAVRIDPRVGRTVRERVRDMPQRTFAQVERDIGLRPVDPMPGVTDAFKVYRPSSILSLPDDRMTKHWDIGLSHLLAFTTELSDGRWDVRIGPYKMFALEAGPILKALEYYGMTHVTVGALERMLDTYSAHTPEGIYTTAEGCMGMSFGLRDGDYWVAFEPAAVLQALTEHFNLSRDASWFEKAAPKVLGCIDWAFGQMDVNRKAGAWDEGLMPPVHMADIGDWGTFFAGDAYYFMAIRDSLRALARLGSTWTVEADLRQGRLESYRQAIRKAYRKSIGLAPVVRLRNGTYVPPMIAKVYLRGFMSDIWPLGPGNALRNAWMDVDFPAKLMEAGIFAPEEPECRWMLDCLEDCLVLDDFLLPKKWDDVDQDPMTSARDATMQRTDYDAERDWFAWGGTGWQNGYCSLMDCYLITGERNAFLRSFYNTYAVEVDPLTYWFREVAATPKYPPKTFEEAVFLYRLRAMLVYEREGVLYLNRCVPDAWYREGFEVIAMPTHYGVLDMKVESRDDGVYLSVAIECREGLDDVTLIVDRIGEIRIPAGGTRWEWRGRLAENLERSH
jgi:hypothetical protein